MAEIAGRAAALQTAQAVHVGCVFCFAGEAAQLVRALSRRFLPATAPDARQHGCLIEEFALHHATGCAGAEGAVIRKGKLPFTQKHIGRFPARQPPHVAPVAA